MHLTHVLFDILGPIVAMIGLGALMRWKFAVDLSSLAKLNIYLFVPAFVFDKVSTSPLAWADMGGIVAVTVLQVVILGLLIAGAGKAMGVSRKTTAAVAMAVMFSNSGNYGIPLAALVYQNQPEKLAVATGAQAFVVMTQNVLTFTVGLTIAAWATHGGVGRGLLALLKMPTLPTLAAALLARAHVGQGGTIPLAIAKTAGYLSDGLVPLALVTLGAQLASNPRWPRWKPIGAVLALRLIFGPVQMLGMLLGLHWLATRFGSAWRAMDLWPMPAELLIITSAVPTAVNTLLLTLEVDGDADLAADCVFWTTLASCVTISAWLLIVPVVMARL